MHSALVALEVAGKLNRIAIDSRSIAKEYALSDDEPSIEELCRIAKKQGFRAAIKEAHVEKLVEAYPLPLLVLKKDGTYMSVVQSNVEKKELLVYDTSSKEPYTLSYEMYEEIASGKVIVLKHRMLSEDVRFGFGWFFHQIMKYKKVSKTNNLIINTY